jgi:hypothetical protein
VGEVSPKTLEIGWIFLGFHFDEITGKVGLLGNIWPWNFLCNFDLVSSHWSKSQILYSKLEIRLDENPEARHSRQTDLESNRFADDAFFTQLPKGLVWFNNIVRITQVQVRIRHDHIKLSLDIVIA